MHFWLAWLQPVTDSFTQISLLLLLLSLELPLSLPFMFILIAVWNTCNIQDWLLIMAI